jgi:alkanesulfonate monooxygenase SsuD/methylene tetrahydromethanopterin reductase-like flavin-dependent oxidoreductase (luciferase family)
MLTAEGCGYDTVWLADYLVPVPPSQGVLLESWVMAAGLGWVDRGDTADL